MNDKKHVNEMIKDFFTDFFADSLEYLVNVTPLRKHGGLGVLIPKYIEPEIEALASSYKDRIIRYIKTVFGGIKENMVFKITTDKMFIDYEEYEGFVIIARDKEEALKIITRKVKENSSDSEFEKPKIDVIGLSNLDSQIVLDKYR